MVKRDWTQEDLRQLLQEYEASKPDPRVWSRRLRDPSRGYSPTLRHQKVTNSPGPKRRYAGLHGASAIIDQDVWPARTATELAPRLLHLVA